MVDAKIEAVAVMDPPGTGAADPDQPKVVTLDPVTAPAPVAERPRHERRRERRAIVEDRAGDVDRAVDDSTGNAQEAPVQGGERKTGRRQRRGDARPRAPRARRSAVDATPADAESAAVDAALVDAGQTAEQALAGASGKGKRGARTAARAKKMQHQAAAAIGSADDNPALGALNRHLNMLLQQLTTSHRVIGRIAAERDALRLQLAELQGVPVDQIKVTAVGGASEDEPGQPRRAHAHAEHNHDTPPAKSTRMQFFGGDDIVQVRKHRQYTVMILLVVIAVGGLIFRHFGVSMPSNVSRDSLATLPYIGAVMQVFLMGWMMYRVVRVGGKGVRWLFPSEEKRRRR